MDSSDDFEPKRRSKKRSCASTCGGGCLGLVVLITAVLSIFYVNTGTYQPKIPPPPAVPNPNALNDYITAGNLLRANGGTKGMTNPNGSGPPMLAAQRKVVAANQPALAAMRRGFQYQCMIPPVRNYNTTYPYLADVRELARLLAAEADVNEADGNHFGAVSDCLDGIQLGTDIVHGGPLIHALVSIAAQAIVQQPLVRNIEKLNAAESEQAAARLQKLLLNKVSPANVMKEERNYSLTSLAALKPSEAVGLWDTSEAMDGGPPSPLSRQAGGFYWHFMRDRTLRELETHYDKLVEETGKPMAQRQPIPEPKGYLASLIAPVFSQAALTMDETDARSRITLCALKLRSYVLAHGKLPESLQALGLPVELTTDPYNGQPLIYKPSGSGYLLYSIGPDLKDSGGIPTDMADSGPSRFQGDIGITRFRSKTSSSYNQFYKLVPHMNPPKLPPGAPPLDK